MTSFYCFSSDTHSSDPLSRSTSPDIAAPYLESSMQHAASHYTTKCTRQLNKKQIMGALKIKLYVHTYQDTTEIQL